MKYIAVLTLLYGLSGCGTIDQIEGKKDNNDDSDASFIGHWYVDCEPEDDDSSNYFGIDWVANESSVSMVYTEYRDKECKTKSWTLKDTENYKVGDSSDVEGATNVDYTTTRYSLTVFSTEIADAYNDTTLDNPGYCGYTKFRIGKEVDLLKDCYPKESERLTYAIFKIDGDELMVSRYTDEKDGTTKAKRADHLQKNWVYKRK